jgi:FkbM family methyltransferase
MSFKNKIIRFISTNRKTLLFRKANEMALKFVKAYNNVSYNSQTNGEMNVFKTIIQEQKCKIFVDCGANDGLDALVYSKIGGASMEVYAFEPVQNTYHKLQKRADGHKNIHCFNLGLGEKEETIIFSHLPDKDYMSSAYHQGAEAIEVECKITAGDTFFNEKAIDKINFLKIDVEGMEYSVLKGFDRMISEGKIDIVQFEYTHNYIQANCLLKNVYEFLNERNYVVGKIYPKNVDFSEYNVGMENFYGANFIAINKNNKNLIQKLSSRQN